MSQHEFVTWKGVRADVWHSLVHARPFEAESFLGYKIILVLYCLTIIAVGGVAGIEHLFRLAACYVR